MDVGNTVGYLTGRNGRSLSSDVSGLVGLVDSELRCGGMKVLSHLEHFLQEALYRDPSTNVRNDSKYIKTPTILINGLGEGKAAMAPLKKGLQNLDRTNIRRLDCNSSLPAAQIVNGILSNAVDATIEKTRYGRFKWRVTAIINDQRFQRDLTRPFDYLRENIDDIPKEALVGYVREILGLAKRSKLKRTLVEVLEKAEKEVIKVDFLTYSKGAVISLDYGIHNQDKVNHIVMLGCPIDGIPYPLAYIARLIPGARDLARGSEYLCLLEYNYSNLLSKGELKVKIANFYTTYDKILLGARPIEGAINFNFSKIDEVCEHNGHDRVHIAHWGETTHPYIIRWLPRFLGHALNDDNWNELAKKDERGILDYTRQRINVINPSAHKPN
ncbi:hypothetical protein HY638_03270 [Candidatus Woesearchaeota archaeon]|nr:hypothetical protein [Candidatus Woesearchaeota archaeon]